MPALSISTTFFSFAHFKGTVPCHITLWKAPAMMRTLFSTAATGTVRLHFSPCSTASGLTLLDQFQFFPGTALLANRFMSWSLSSVAPALSSALFSLRKRP
jgi:hypothetical protein